MFARRILSASNVLVAGILSSIYCSVFFFKVKTGYEIRLVFVGSVICIRESWVSVRGGDFPLCW